MTLSVQNLWDAPHIIIHAKVVRGENHYIILEILETKIYAAVFTQT
jgi:hypothetical protein